MSPPSGLIRSTISLWPGSLNIGESRFMVMLNRSTGMAPTLRWPSFKAKDDYALLVPVGKGMALVKNCFREA